MLCCAAVSAAVAVSSWFFVCFLCFFKRISFFKLLKTFNLLIYEIHYFSEETSMRF